MYDPYAHAASLGVEVTWGRVAPGHDAEYDAARDLIILRRGLTARKERCVLAHEVVHAEHGDIPSPFGPINLRQERRADQHSALRLINEGDFRRAIRLSQDPAEWCLELGVTADALETYLSLIERRSLMLKAVG